MPYGPGDYPVFPHTETTLEGSGAGLSKREYFAAMALQGLLANSTSSAENTDPTDFGRLAVEQADRLIDALEAK